MSSFIGWTDDDAVLLKYAPGDTIAGESFTRSTTAYQNDLTGALVSKAINEKRDGHYTNVGVRSLLLEGGSTNLLLRSAEFENAVWLKTNITVTANNTTAPDGNLTGDKVAATASAATVFSQDAVVAATSASYSIYIKKGSGATDANRFEIYNVTTATDLLVVDVNYDTGAITYIVGAAGATLATDALAGWFRLTLTVTAGITSGNTIRAYPFFTGGVQTAGEFAYAWGAQLEGLPFATSYIPTVAATVARGADQYSLPFTTPPQEMTVYTKFQERGTIFNVGAGRAFAISSGATSPILQLFAAGTGYDIEHISGADLASLLATAPVLRDIDEIASRLYGDGSVDAVQSINGAASTSSTQSAANALATAWSGPLCWLNSAGAIGVGYTAIQSFKIVAGVRSLAEMRAIASPIQFSNGRPTPLDRFGNWTPMSKPVGPAETALGTGQRYTFRFRTDHTVSFEIRNIPNTLLWQALRLQDHLLRGGLVSVNTGDSLNSAYTQCCLAPDTVPQVTMSDARELEYTMSLTLLNVHGTPFRMIAQY